MSQIRVNFEPFIDDETNPDERIIAFHNGLPESEPPSDYQGGLIRFRLLPHLHLEVELYLLTEGVTIRAPRENRALEPVVMAHWVRSPEGIWLVLDGREVGIIVSEDSRQLLTDFVTDIARVFGRTLVWEDDIDEEEED